MRPTLLLRAVLLAFPLLASVPAQDLPAAPALPRVMLLGPLPAASGAVELVLPRPGVLPDDLAGRLAGARAVLLRVDRDVAAGRVGGLLRRCRELGVEQVWFAAELPGGRGTGALGLPLAAAGRGEESTAELVLTAHRDRPGVPPESAVPLLRRIRAGAVRVERDWVLEVRLPGDVAFERVLQVLAAVAAVELPAVRLRWQPASGAMAADTALALDLGPVPALQVRAQTAPPAPPTLRTEPLGLQLPDADHRPGEAGGAAGGRYGGRQGGRQRLGDTAGAAAIAGALQWLGRSQRPDGSWSGVDPDRGDVEATALAVLALLGDGQTLTFGEQQQALAAGVGWLLAQQDPEGRIGAAGARGVAAHAAACYALLEATGLSPNGWLLAGATGDALEWLAARRLADGGLPAADAGRSSEAVTTVVGAMALLQAETFRLRGGLPPSALVPYYEGLAADDAGQAAAALLGRFFAGQDPAAVAAMPALAQRVLDRADIDEPWTAWLATTALFQAGGRYWRGWAGRLTALVAERVEDGAEAGSWAPADGCSRTVTTALRALTLEAYYRYTRLVR